MRTPTALLRICALLGNQNAREKVSIRDQLKPLTLKQIRNHLPTGWSRAPRIDPGVVVTLPRARLTALPLQPERHEAPQQVQPCSPTSVSNRLACIVTTKGTSWLHHGPGARIPVPKSGNERHPLGFDQAGLTSQPSVAMDALDRQAAALVQGEKDLGSFFGEVDGYDAEAIDVASPLTLANQIDDTTSADANDAESPSLLSDSDSDDEWDPVSAEERIAADVRFDKETREIEAFEAMLNAFSDDNAAPAVDIPPPPPLPPATGTPGPPSPRPSPGRMAHALFSSPSHDDLMADMLIAVAQRQARQARQASVESTVSSAASAPPSPVAAGLVKGFELMTDTHKESLSGYSSDSGRGSHLLDAGADSDHGWSDSEA